MVLRNLRMKGMELRDGKKTGLRDFEPLDSALLED